MTKSLPKMRPSELSSRMGRVPAGLMAPGAVQGHASKRNGAPVNDGARFAVTIRGDEALGARLRLLEGFLSRTELADCAQFALQWLGEVVGVSQSICLVKPVGEQTLFAAAAYGLPSASVATFPVSLDEWVNPLVAIVNDGRYTFYGASHSPTERRRRPWTPFEDAPFHVVPLGVPGVAEEAFGLLLIAGTAPLTHEFHWFTSVFSQKLDEILRQQALAEGDRKQSRERSLLHSIINAVSDPILLTDTEGRDRKSTRLNSSHSQISYAVFCLKKKKKKTKCNPTPH